MNGRHLKVDNQRHYLKKIAEVIAGWTGIPLTRINETESIVCLI